MIFTLQIILGIVVVFLAVMVILLIPVRCRVCRRLHYLVEHFYFIDPPESISFPTCKSCYLKEEKQ